MKGKVIVIMNNEFNLEGKNLTTVGMLGAEEIYLAAAAKIGIYLTEDVT